MLPVLLLSCLCLNAQDATKVNELPILGRQWVRGTITPNASTPNLTYHGGPILQSTIVEAIFWGSSWGSSPGDKISGMDKWYSHIGTVAGGGGSSYFATVDEYTQSNGKRVLTATTYSGHKVDTTSAPSNPSTSQVLSEVCKVVGSTAKTNGYYPVYVDRPRKTNFCAYHSFGSCNGTKVQFAFFWKLDGDAGCDPQSNVSGQSQGLKALANVSGHELSEARSDPRLNAWFDGSGSENADKCAWVFGSPYVTFLDGTHWKIQGNWSNYAHNHSTGYGAQKGCVDGAKFPGPYTK
jgi:hypothetical protein